MKVNKVKLCPETSWNRHKWKKITILDASIHSLDILNEAILSKTDLSSILFTCRYQILHSPLNKESQKGLSDNSAAAVLHFFFLIINQLCVGHMQDYGGTRQCQLW